MSSFIQDQMLYNAHKRIEEKEQQFLTLQTQNERLHLEVKNLNDSAAKADSEIFYLRNLRDQKEREVGDLKHRIDSLEQDKSKSIETLTLKFAYDTDKLRKQVDEMKRSLMKFHNVQLRVTDISQQSVDEQRPITTSELEDIKSNLRSSEIILNQLLISQNQSQSAATNTSNVRGSQSTAVKAQTITQPAVQEKEQPGIGIQSNRLVQMIERFESGDHDQLAQDQNDVYNKLHLEILQFRDSIKEILAEMQPLKEHLIESLTLVIQKALPNSEVKVYGSHATKLCLPWSDIDLVIVTNTVGRGGQIDHPKSVLSLINKELQSELQNKWVSHVTYIDNATVPVVKVSCHIKDLLMQQTSAFNQEEYDKYRIFLEQPFNIDITQMTDHHNGLECVRLV